MYKIHAVVNDLVKIMPINKLNTVGLNKWVP